jgi:DNA-binding transcriptional LysR family regulator
MKGFYYAVQTGSISSSAKKMRLSQAAVTLQIQSLERDLKLQLFKREKGKIKLTEAGKIFYAQASYYIQGIEDLFEGFTKFIDDKKLNIIDLASNHAVISYILPKYLKKFKITHPEAQFKIRNLAKSDCIERLLRNEIDMFIYPMNAGEIPDELEFFPIAKYQPILLVRRDHPLAKKENLTLADVAKFELVRIDPKLITLPAFEEIIKSHRLKTSIEFEMSDWEILKKFVKADIGVAIISNIVLEGENDNDLIGRNLTNYFPEMTYGVLIKKGKKLNGLLKKFLNLLTTEKLLQIQTTN